MEREIEIRGGGRRRRFEVGLGSGGTSGSRQRRGGQAAALEGRTIAGGEVRLHGLGSEEGGGGSSARRHGRGLRAPPRPLVRGVDFAPDTQEPHTMEDVDEGPAGLEFVPDSEDDSGDGGLFPYDSDEVLFVPDSVIGAEEEVVPDSVLDDGVDDLVVAPGGAAADVVAAEDRAGDQLDDTEVCYSMLRILLPAYFKIPGNENLGM